MVIDCGGKILIKNALNSFVDVLAYTEMEKVGCFGLSKVQFDYGSDIHLVVYIERALEYEDKAY